MNSSVSHPFESGSSDPWTIVEARFDPASAKAYEGLFTLGSGYLHVRGSLEEHLPDQPQNVEYERRAGNVTSEKFREVLAQWGTYVPGVFARHPTLNNQMVNLPWPLGLAVVVEAERLDVLGSGGARVVEYRRELRLRTAVLWRRVVWETKRGVRVSVEWERFVSAVRTHLIVQRVTVTADKACRIEVVGGIDADVRTNGYWHFAETKTGGVGEGRVACEVTTDAGDRVSVEGSLWVEGQRAEARETCSATRGRSCEVSIAGDVAAGVPMVVQKRTWVSTSRDLPIKSVGTAEDAFEQGWSELLSEHCKAWDWLWECSDVTIEGDAESQRAARAAMFHLLRAPVPHDSRVAIDAKGYAGEAYWGRYFWDTEMYLLPFYLYTLPEAARTLAEFRVHTLAGAKRNAARYGYPGARYAWESDANGDECCPNWQYADHEVHVTADVAYGLAHYAAGADDEGFLRHAGGGAEVLVETARYWMERITFEDRATLSRPRLLGVMGPDEYKPITSDNAYTNRMVAEGLRLAARYGGNCEGVTEGERDTWRRTADALPVLRGADSVLVMQCEGFDGLADPEFDRLWKDRGAGGRTFAAQVSQERLYRSKCLKQADVLMLMALFPGEFTDAEVQRAWDYYLPYTTHDSSLSAGAHCLVACRLGLDEQAWDFWRRGSRQDLPEADGGEGGAAEGIHIAGAGAVWQMAVLGFAGMGTSMQAGELTLRPRLPKKWTGLRFPLEWKGQAVRVEIERGATRVTNRSDRPLAASVSGVRRVIAARATETFA